MSPKVRQAVAIAAAETGISPEDIMDMTTKVKPITRARWLAWLALRNEGWSLCKIAMVWGCHHTSVCHGTNTLKMEMKNDSRKLAATTEA
jgi:chromosomal replication initiation ATPase DnaA